MRRRIYARVEEVEIEVVVAAEVEVEVVAAAVTLGLMSKMELGAVRMYVAVAEG